MDQDQQAEIRRQKHLQELDQLYEQVKKQQDQQQSVQQQQQYDQIKNAKPLPQYQQMGRIKKALFVLENYLKFMFVSSILTHHMFQVFIVIMISILQIIRQRKLCNEPTFNLFYVLLLSLRRQAYPTRQIDKQQNEEQTTQTQPKYEYSFVESFHLKAFLILYMVPLIIYYIVGISEYLQLKQDKYYHYFKSRVQKSIKQKQQLIRSKHQLEIGLLIIYLLFFRATGGFYQYKFYLAYYLFLLVKCRLNAQMKHSVIDIYNGSGNSPIIRIVIRLMLGVRIQQSDG